MSSKVSNKKFSVREGKPSPEMSIDIRNDELIAKINECKKAQSNEALNDLIKHLVTCRVLIPAAMNSENKPAPKLVKTNEGDTYLGIYTDKDQVPVDQRKSIFLNLPYLAANKLSINPDDKIQGIVINPFTDNFILKRPLLERIEEIEVVRKNAVNNAKAREAALAQFGEITTDDNGNKLLKMNEKQYTQFERTEFEVGFIPQRLFANPKEFVDNLSAKKEEFIDQLFEESYRNKRMYPYLPEDFSVMPLSISDDFTIIRVDMPGSDLIFGNAYRLYIAYNKSTELIRYFRIIKGKEKDEVLLEEIRSDKKIFNLGAAPVEGTELSKITELCDYKPASKE